MTPKRFLGPASVVLIGIGLFGVMGVLGSISSASFFHPPYWINRFHLGLGFFVLTIAIVGSEKWQAGVTFLATVMGLTLGLMGLLLGTWAAQKYNIPELADPSDHLAHLTVGLVAAWDWWGSRGGKLRAAFY